MSFPSKKKRANSAPTSCLFRKMPPRCEFRRPRFFFLLRSSPDFPEPRRTQHEKPVWCRAASLVNGEVCILPQPAQAVVQTRRLNEAWSGQLFGSVMQSEAPLRPIVSGCAVTPGQEFCWDYRCHSERPSSPFIKWVIFHNSAFVSHRRPRRRDVAITPSTKRRSCC